MIKVLVVEDSLSMARLIGQILQSDPGIEVVGYAEDPYEAREMIKEKNPDVLTLDIALPKMDGLTFLRNIMRLRPTPTVMVSSLTQDGAKATVSSLRAGAIDCISKPVGRAEPVVMQKFYEELLVKVKMAATANLHAFDRIETPENQQPVVLEEEAARSIEVIAIAASTGGTEALRVVLSQLGPQTPPVVVTQHMLPQFIERYVERLREELSLAVIQVTEEIALNPGTVYFAPATKHLAVKKTAGDTLVALPDDRVVSSVYLPAADVMLETVAIACKDKAIGVILTGMGDDGTCGLIAMKKAGAYTIAQDKNSSLIWGMPKSAVESGSVQKELTLRAIGPKIKQLLG